MNYWVNLVAQIYNVSIVNTWTIFSRFIVFIYVFGICVYNKTKAKYFRQVPFKVFIISNLKFDEWVNNQKLWIENKSTLIKLILRRRKNILHISIFFIFMLTRLCKNNIYRFEPVSLHRLVYCNVKVINTSNLFIHLYKHFFRVCAKL